MSKRQFDIIPFVLAASAIVTIIILVSVYYYRTDGYVRRDEPVAYKHSQVKHDKAKEY